MQEIRVDTREFSPEERAKYARQTELMFQFNHSLPGSDENTAALKELLGDRFGEGSRIGVPLAGAALDQLVIGKNVVITSGLLAMARGGITIEDNVMIAANVQLISNNHDPYDRMVLPCKPVRIKTGAWVGAGATILPGVTVGRHAIVGAASVVTRDVPDYAVVVGNPARVIKTLDKDKF